MKRHIKNRQKGGVMILTVIFFLIISFIIITSSSFIALKDVRNANNQLYGKISYYTAESGFEDAYYRLKNALSIASNTLTLGNNTTRVTLTASATSTSILSEATSTSFYKRIQSAVALGDGVSFHYGIQSGAGGFTLSN